jgi:Sec-independent protein secretion pathway component TatC
LAIPIILLYESSIWIGKMIERKRERADLAAEAADPTIDS